MFTFIATLLPWGDIYAVARDVFYFLDAALFFGVVFLALKDSAFKPAFDFLDEKGRKKGGALSLRIEKEWGRVLAKGADGTPHSRTLMVIEADKLLDDVLKSLGFSGEHLAERLEQFGKTRRGKTLEKVWQAHRIRNNLVHASGFEVSEGHAKEVLEAYRAFFEELGVL